MWHYRIYYRSYRRFLSGPVIGAEPADRHRNRYFDCGPDEICHRNNHDHWPDCSDESSDDGDFEHANQSVMDGGNGNGWDDQQLFCGALPGSRL